MRLKAAFLSGWMVFVVAGCRQLAATPQANHANIVFQIGVFDRSSAEFAGGSPKQPVDFIVGQGSPANDWYAAQPAILSSSLGQHAMNDAAAPRTITFSLAHAPAAAYQLHIAVLIETASVPALQVGINGKHGMFYLQPKLDSKMGAMIDSLCAGKTGEV